MFVSVKAYHMFVVKMHCEDAGAEFSEITDRLQDFHKSFFQSSCIDNDSLKNQMEIFGFYLGTGKFNDVASHSSDKPEITFHELQVEDCDAAIAARDNKSFDVIQAFVLI